MKTTLFLSLSLILAGVAFSFSGCRTAGSAPGRGQFPNAPMAKEPRPYYPPIAPQSQFKIRRY